MTTRCWVMRRRSGTLCDKKLGRHHGTFHSAEDAVFAWEDEDCAPDAGPTGRKTAALRLLELSHDLDRISFLLGERLDDRLRPVAVCLFAGTEDAKANLAILESWPRDINAGATYAEETRDILQMAADILRPWAEGRQ